MQVFVRPLRHGTENNQGIRTSFFAHITNILLLNETIYRDSAFQQETKNILCSLTQEKFCLPLLQAYKTKHSKLN